MARFRWGGHSPDPDESEVLENLVSADGDASWCHRIPGNETSHGLLASGSHPVNPLDRLSRSHVHKIVLLASLFHSSFTNQCRATLGDFSEQQV